MEGYAPIGKVCPVHRGEYRADGTYRINDIVTYQRSTYWHKAEQPTRGVLPTDETVWQVLVPYQEMVKRKRRRNEGGADRKGNHADGGG